MRLSVPARRRLRARLAACALLLAAAPAPAPAEDRLSGAALVDALRAGGLNLYFRHAETEWAQRDDVREAGDWESCDPSRIRQLSDEGRETARRVGAAIRALALPVGKVLSSPYCRCVETAERMGLGPVTTTLDVMNMRTASYVGGRARVVETAQRLLSSAPPAGTNTVIVAHGNVARMATPVYPDEGEGVVFLPLGERRFRVLAVLALHAWERLAEEFAQATP